MIKILDSFDFRVIPSLNKKLAGELAQYEYIERRLNVITLCNSGMGKTHIATGLDMEACQKGMPTLFSRASTLVNELMEARGDRRLVRFK